ncbi:Putative hydrolase [hydrothermal vent metagenome]|uniref:Hydrolase n=1 Tax=hydrothermal vent metagenome TaxID=652676 RepID=A0A3B0WKJ6_9ZZZZ
MNNQEKLTKPDKNIIDTKVYIEKKPRSTPIIIKALQIGFKIGGMVAPKLAGCAAYKLWITPPRFKTPKSEVSAELSAKIEYHSIGNQSIASYQWGDSGPTILLVHGWSGRGTQLGAFAQALVDTGFRVLSFDAPAHGKSSGKQTNIYEIAETISTLENLYGPFKSVITHSFGGPCLAIAMKQGLKTTCVVNISPPSKTLGLVKKFTDALTLPKNVENELMRCIEKNFGENVWHDSSMENNIQNLDVPALVIHDADDVDIPWHEGQSIAKAWNEVRFIKTKNLGHRRILRDPATIKTTVDFIKGL